MCNDEARYSCTSPEPQRDFLTKEAIIIVLASLTVWGADVSIAGIL